MRILSFWTPLIAISSCLATLDERSQRSSFNNWGKLESDQKDHEGTSLWISQKEVSLTGHGSGISVSRTVDDNEINLYVELDEENHCHNHDVFGSNECHYSWGETVHLLDLHFDGELNEGDVVTGSFEIDFFVDWNFQCNVCGETCTLKIPFISQEISIQTPSCPITADSFVPYEYIPLPDTSPLDGVTTRMSGYAAIQKSTGEVLVSANVNIVIK